MKGPRTAVTAVSPGVPENRLWRAGAQLAESPRFSVALLAVILVSEFCVLSLRASGQLFWYDELLTLHVSALQPFSLLWQALLAGADGMPPMYYVTVRLARLLPVDPHVTLRLPSVFGYLLSLLGIYWFARKRLPVSACLAAVALTGLSPFREYAVEARSYSLLVGFLAMSAVAWQRIGEQRFMTPLLALFLSLAVSYHYLAVVVISCFGAAELTRTLLLRRIRWGVWAACLAASIPFFISLPVLLRFREIFGGNFWARPGWRMTVMAYESYLGIATILVFAFLVFFGLVLGDLLLRTARAPAAGLPDKSFDLPEIVLVGGFLYYPAVLGGLSKLLGSGYTPRYGWPAVIGLVLALVYLLWPARPQALAVHVLAALLVAFAALGAQDVVKLASNPARSGSAKVDERWIQLAELSRGHPGVPVVIGSGKEYLAAAEYAPAELRDRLVGVADADAAARIARADTLDKANQILARFVPLRVEDLASFQAAYPAFLLYSGGGSWEEWMTRYLIEQRYRLRLLSQDGEFSTYFVER